MTKFEAKITRIQSAAETSEFLKTTGATAKYLGLSKSEVEKALAMGIIAKRTVSQWNGRSYKLVDNYVIR